MMNLHKILVPVDFSECSRAAFLFAVELARPLHAKLMVLHVWDVPFLWPSVGDVPVAVPDEPPMTVGELVKRRATEELERFLAANAPKGVEVHGRLEMGDPVTVVCEMARDHHDLVVMGTHGRTGLSRVLAGSVAENIVRRCEKPVLTVRTPENGSAEPVAVAT